MGKDYINCFLSGTLRHTWCYNDSMSNKADPKVGRYRVPNKSMDLLALISNEMLGYISHKHANDLVHQAGLRVLLKEILIRRGAESIEELREKLLND